MFVKIEGTKMLWYSSQSQFLSWTNCNNFIMLNSTPVVGEDFSVDYLQWLWNNIYIKNISTVYVHLNYRIAYRKKNIFNRNIGKNIHSFWIMTTNWMSFKIIYSFSYWLTVNNYILPFLNCKRFRIGYSVEWKALLVQASWKSHQDHLW